MRNRSMSCLKLGCGLLVVSVLLGCPLAQRPSDDGGSGGNNGGGDDGGVTGKLAVFQDPDSDFSTTDVHDVEDQIVQFNTETNSIVWAEDGTEYQAGTWVVDGNFPSASGAFLIRFGTKDGERRAYFTETIPETICDIRVANGTLSIFPSTVTVPQE